MDDGLSIARTTPGTTPAFDWRPWLYGLAAVALLSAASMAWLDRPAALYFRDAFDHQQKTLFNAMGEYGKPETYFAVAAVLALGFWLAGRKLAAGESARAAAFRRRMHASLFVIFSVAAAGVLINVLKFVIGRLRPRELFEHGLYGFQPFNTDFGMNSFPSGHSQMVWSLAVALFLVFPRLWPAYFAFAAAIAASRFLGSVHYVSDVLMGSYLGAAVPVLLKHYAYDRRGIAIGPGRG